MAKTTAKPAGTARTTAAPKAEESKEVAKTMSQADLVALAAQTAQIESDSRDSVGTEASYIKLLGNVPNDPITNKDKPEYIRGAKDGSFVIENKKLHLGQNVDVTVLGIFKLYEDTVAGDAPKGKQDSMRKIVGYWMPVDAENVPLEGYFDRPFIDKDGVEHILRPVHWVYLHLHKFPEVDDARLTFRSKGNSICKDLEKLIKAHSKSGASAEVRLTMKSQYDDKNSYGRSYIYPDFEYVGQNYSIKGGKLAIEAEDLEMEDLQTILTRANAMNSEYADYKMVAKKRDLSRFIGGVSTPAITDGSDDDDEDEEITRF